MFIEFILEKSDKMRDLSNILSLIRNEFNKSNNTGAQLFDSIYHMTLNCLIIAFWRENGKMLPSFPQRYNGRHYVTKSINHWWFIDLFVWRFITSRCDIM